MKTYLIKFSTAHIFGVVLFFTYMYQAQSSIANRTNLKPCHLTVAPKILFLKKAKKLSQVSEIVKKSSFCNKGEIAMALDVLWRLDGKITSEHFNRLVREEGWKKAIQLEPKVIEIFHLDNLVRDRVSLKGNLRLDRVSVIGAVYAIAIDGLSDLELQCHGCHSTGSKNLSIVYSGPFHQGYQKNVWATIKILEMKRVVIVNEDIGPFVRDGIQNYVKLISRVLEKSHRYLNTVTNLEYFNVNKHIKKGTLLKRSDLTPRKIVKAGKPTKVIINQGGLKIQAEAIARQSGRYGEFVNLYNPKSRKKIRAKVIGFNKVKVDL